MKLRCERHFGAPPLTSQKSASKFFQFLGLFAPRAIERSCILQESWIMFLSQGFVFPAMKSVEPQSGCPKNFSRRSASHEPIWRSFIRKRPSRLASEKTPRAFIAGERHAL